MVSFKTILQEGSQRQNINNGHDCVPIKLYLHKQALGQMWPSSCSLLTTELARFNCCSDSCITKVSFSSNRTSVNNLMWSGCFTVSGTQATCLVFLPYCVVQDGMSIPTFKPAGRGKRVLEGCNPKLYTILLVPHWPEFSYMAIPSCKRGWEM